MLAVALGIHSTMDGAAIALEHQLKAITFPLFLSVLIHKFPEGLALCALLIKGGFSKSRAVLTAIGFESTTLFGWFLAEYPLKGNLPMAWVYLMLAHIGGGFVYLALHALFNESREHSARFVTSFFILGIGFIALATLVLP
jgi:zinc transporter ZupT